MGALCRYREEEGRELSTWEKKWGRGPSRAEKGGQGHGSHESPRAPQIQGGCGTEARSPRTAALVGEHGRTETSRWGGELWLVLESGEKAVQGGQEMPWVGGLVCTLRVEFGKNWV